MTGEDMAEKNVRKRSDAATSFGWLSVILSAAGMIGVVLLLIGGNMPRSNNHTAQISSEDARRLVVFVLGIGCGFLLPFSGGFAAIVSIITMLSKRNFKKFWLPILGIIIGFIVIAGTVFGMTYMTE